MKDSQFYTEWRKYQGREVEEKDQQPLCPVAAEFISKLEETIFTPLGKQPTRGQIAQAKYMLQETWQAWRKSMPAVHVLLSDGHHRCLDDAYDASYDRLHLIDLTHRPALNVIADHEEYTKPPPPAPIVNLKRIVRPQVTGIAIAEKKESVETGVQADEELIREIEELAEVESVEGAEVLAQITGHEGED